MFKGFKDFVLRGNVMDLAVAVVIGAAFGRVVTSFTEGFVQPLINSAGEAGSPALGFFLRDNDPKTFVDLGGIISAFVNFLLVAAVVYFVIVLPVNRLLALRKQGQVAEPKAPSEDVLLLQEIRDLLRARQP